MKDSICLNYMIGLLGRHCNLDDYFIFPVYFLCLCLPCRFEKGITALPLLDAEKAPPAHIDPRAYIPPPLCRKAMGWNPEWMKPSSGWGFPSYGW